MSLQAFVLGLITFHLPHTTLPPWLMPLVNGPTTHPGTHNWDQRNLPNSLFFSPQNQLRPSPVDFISLISPTFSTSPTSTYPTVFTLIPALSFVALPLQWFILVAHSLSVLQRDFCFPSSHQIGQIMLNPCPNYVSNHSIPLHLSSQWFTRSLLYLRWIIY